MDQPAPQPVAPAPAPAAKPNKLFRNCAIGCGIASVLFVMLMCAALKSAPPTSSGSTPNTQSTLPRTATPKPQRTAEAERKAAPATAPVEQQIKVTAKALADEYSDNAVAAGKKYEGKRILVSGTITDIGKDVVDTAYVVLKGGGEAGIHNVQCMFRKDQEDVLATLKKGQQITIEGEPDGLALGINVILKYSQVVR